MQTILNTDVSVFENYVNAKPLGNINLCDWLMSSGYQDDIEKLRMQKQPDKIKSIKMGLPAITPSGRFTCKRTLSNLKSHTSFICIDIDGKDNSIISDWDKVKHDISNSANIAYAGLSASGQGLFVLVPIAYPDRHLEHFQAIEFYFLVNHGIYIDKACKDICRLRGISYDAAPYFNHSALPMCKCLKSAHTLSIQPYNSTGATNGLQNMLDSVMTLKSDITENYHDWFCIGCILANTYGKQGREMYHRISSLSNKYKPADCDKQYNMCLKTKYNYGIGTLIHIINKYK